MSKRQAEADRMIARGAPRTQKTHSVLTSALHEQEIGTQATSLAHELNQPLTAIANYVEAAREMLQRNATNIATIHNSLEKSARPADASILELLNEHAETLADVCKSLDDCAGQSVRAAQIAGRLRDLVSRGDRLPS